jgi:hypothetical protein
VVFRRVSNAKNFAYNRCDTLEQNFVQICRPSRDAWGVSYRGGTRQLLRTTLWTPFRQVLPGSLPGPIPQRNRRSPPLLQHFWWLGGVLDGILWSTLIKLFSKMLKFFLK